MDTQTTPSSSPGSVNASRWGAATWIVFLAVTLVCTATEAQSRAGGTRRSGTRLIGPCGGDQLDGVCPSACSNSPFEPWFDADCMSCEQFDRPEPKPACKTHGQRCEIHEAIVRMGAMIATGEYDESVMREVVFAYWNGAAWILEQHWGASALDGYVVYSVVRAAIEFREDLARHPATMIAMQCMLRDHASRGMPTTVDNGERFFHGGEKTWNSWSEGRIGSDAP